MCPPPQPTPVHSVLLGLSPHMDLMVGTTLLRKYHPPAQFEGFKKKNSLITMQATLALIALLYIG